MSGWIGTLVQGLLLGGLYALYATGLSLIFGIMRLVNLAHGDLIVFGAFLILALSSALGVDTFVAFAISVPVMFAIGFGLQWLLLNRTLGADILPPLLVTFGLSIVIQNTGCMESSPPTPSACRLATWRSSRSTSAAASRSASCRSSAWSPPSSSSSR
jgi:branched-chain amino acid transport system permease protein